MNCFSNCHPVYPQTAGSGCSNGCAQGCVSPDTKDSCCNAANLCNFEGDMSKVVSEPIYVQKIYDAVLLNLQGLKTVSEQRFTPSIPSGFRIAGISEIK